jgi:ribosomal protein S1
MTALVDNAGRELIPIREGKMVEGTVLNVSRQRVLVDVKGYALGFVPEREFSSTVLELKPGDPITAYVLLAENDDGYVVLSLKRADRERYTKALDDAYQKKETISVRVKDANRGGLLVEFGNIEGFLPVSQLASAHYPKVGGDRDAIQTRLKELTSKLLDVKVINFDPRANKLIFSEKAAGDALAEERAATLPIGERLTGTITGIVDFGLFVRVNDVEGLVHISEVSWERVTNLRDHFHLGQSVDVMVTEVTGGRVSLSMKRLTVDPWVTKTAALTVGQTIHGRVAKLTSFGAFVEVLPDVMGLIHISEFSLTGEERLSSRFPVASQLDCSVMTIDADHHRINLAPVGLSATPSAARTAKTQPAGDTGTSVPTDATPIESD